ncbi:MAG: Zn-dependent alcohol dehydrogenase [Acidobacteriota bacterium]|nr:Zn-dependent alcohol dehydrogenase [Acidobacteriota bacterium]
MKAAVLREVGKPMEIEDVTISKPGPQEVLIRTSATGVCHSDLHFVDGLWPIEMPVILGHESAGIVEQVGELVRHVSVGDHVITCLSVFCGYCEHCISGHPARCGGQSTDRAKDDEPRLSDATQPLGQFAHLASFAEQLLVHENAVVKIREDMPMDKAALIGCGVMTGVGAVFRTAKVEPGSTVAVIGCGGVGLSAINGAAMAGASRVIAVDVVDSKLELAKTFGATDVVNGANDEPVKAVRSLTNGGVHYSFEAIGLKLTAEQSWGMLRTGGTATIIGMIPFGQKIEIPGHQFLSERRIQGSTMGSNRFRIDMPRFVDFYLAGKLHLDDLLSAHVRLGDVNEALQNLKTGEVARQVILFDAA